MIPSARPTVPLVTIIIFKRRLLCFCDILKIGDGVRTDGNMPEHNDHYCGLAEWINNSSKELSKTKVSSNANNSNNGQYSSTVQFTASISHAKYQKNGAHKKLFNAQWISLWKTNYASACFKVPMPSAEIEIEN